MLTTATLHPVLYPGSSPKTFFSFKGGCNKRFFKFSLNTAIASVSLFSVKTFLTSLLIDGKINLSKASDVIVFKNSKTDLFENSPKRM